MCQPTTRRIPQGICIDDLPDLDRLGNQEMAERGLIDVTAAPFHADPSGERDSSDAIQAAVIFGREHKLALWFPFGCYLITRTIRCVAGWTEERTPLRRYLPHCEYWPCVLLGEQLDGRRPSIVLAAHAPGFQDPESPRPMLDFHANNWVRPRHGQAPHPGRQGNVNMGQTFSGIDCAIGAGNPGAACISFDAAEWSSLEEARLQVGDGYAGVLRGPGCGALIAQVEIVGGAYGCIADSGRPPATYVGCRFLDQRRCAVRKSDRANLTLVGCEFSLPRGVHAARVYPQKGSSLSLVDCRISYEPGAAPTTAILADASLYLREVFVRNADVLVESTRHGPFAGTAGWRCVHEAAFPYRYQSSAWAPVYRDGEGADDVLFAAEEGLPPDDLCARHRWTDLPRWNDPRAVDARDCGAVGDGEHDDTAALQHAIDEHQIVFLPKGAYRVSRTLRLRPETCLFGVHAAYSIIAPLASGDFADPAATRPVLQTVDQADARTRLASFGVYLPRELAPGASFIDWACGGDSWLHGVFPSAGFVRPDFQPLHAGIMPWSDWCWQQIDCAVDQHAFHYTTPATDELIGHDPVPDWPLARIHGHGGGRWYAFVANLGRRHAARYRHLLVEHVTGPLRIYNAVLQFARGDCEFEIADSSEVAIYGIKNEKASTLAWIHGCRGLLITGLSGTGQHNPEQKFLIEDSSDIAIANSIDDCYGPDNDSSQSHHHPHIREHHDGQEFLTAAYERPVLYRRS